MDWSPYQQKLYDRRRRLQELAGAARCPTEEDPYVPETDTFEAPQGRTIAEFEPMAGVLVSYLYEDSLQEHWGFGVPPELLTEFAGDATLYILLSPGISDESMASLSTDLADAGLTTDDVTIIPALLDTWWVRDYGPFFSDGLSGAPTTALNHVYDRIFPVDWDFGGCRMNDNEVPGVVADFLGIPVSNVPITQSGGNMMFDGKADGMGVSVGILTNDNAGGFPAVFDYTAEEIHDVMKQWYGLSEFQEEVDPIGTYIDHVDTWAKFVSNDVIVVSRVPESNPDYAAVEAVMRNIDTWGKTVYRLDLNLEEGGPTGYYLNSLIMNNKIYVPLLTDQGSGAEDRLNRNALQQWEEYTGMEAVGIVGFDPLIPVGDYPGNENSAEWKEWFVWDALHCRTKGIPLAAIPSGFFRT